MLTWAHMLTAAITIFLLHCHQVSAKHGAPPAELWVSIAESLTLTAAQTQDCVLVRACMLAEPFTAMKGSGIGHQLVW